MIFSLLLNVGEWFDCHAATVEQTLAQEKLDGLKAKRTELANVQKQIDQKRPMVELLDQVRVSEFAWMTILADTSRITPNDVFLSNFGGESAKDGISLHVSGTALDAQTVGLFMTAMHEKTGWAQLPTLSSISSSGDEKDGKRVRFDLTVPVRDLMGGDL